MLRTVVGIVIVATFVGAMMPGRTSPAFDESNSNAPDPWFGERRTVQVSTAGDTQGWGISSKPAESASGGEVRLTRRSNGHFYADVEVNGTNVEFMIDTGATGVALTEKDAVKAGLNLDQDQSSYIGEGAGGALTGKIVRLDRVRLGDHTETGMTAVVIDGAETNLLGQSFLSQFAEVTVRGDVMTLR
jgi:aspartyl protease family protein